MCRPRTGAALAAALAVVLACLSVSGGPAAAGTHRAAADDAYPLTVRLTSLSPVSLKPGRTLHLRGSVVNTSVEAWADASVYLVIRPTPLTTRTEIDDLLAAGPSTGGSRLVESGTFADIGSMAPTQTRRFNLKIPYDSLGISGAAGVYPVGVQVLATDTDGIRGDAVGAASTLVPLVPERTARVDVQTVWPFLTTLRRGPDGHYVDPGQIVSAVGPDGRLRRLLDLATATGGADGTVLVDPALLDALRDIGRGEYGPEVDPPSGGETSASPPSPTTTGEAVPAAGSDTMPDATARRDAQVFLTDLVQLARTHPLWVLGYGRPDELALAQTSDGDGGRTVSRAARRASRQALVRYRLRGRPVYWPANGLAAPPTLASVRSRGTNLAMLSPKVLPGWTPAAGAVLDTAATTTATAETADVPASDRIHTLVTDPTLLIGGNPGRAALETRQRALSEAALLAIAPTTTGGPPPSVGLVLGPDWDPGAAWGQADLGALYDAPWVRPANADSAVQEVGADAAQAVQLPRRPAPSSIRPEQVRAAARLVRKGRSYASMIGRDDGTAAYYDESGALTVSSSRRSDRATALANARVEDAAASRLLGKVTVRSNPYVTLSGTSGRFPLTLTNDLDRSVRVGVDLKSDNPRLDLVDIEPVDIAAGESITVPVRADVGKVSSSAVTARLTTPAGTRFGTPARFNVRTSVVGRIIWIGLGVAGLLVVVAFGRQIRNRRRQRGRVTSDPAPAPADPNA